jgi:hypothetical protein
MSVVGAFPGLNERLRKPARGPINPLDRATVVSIYPKEIDEKKVTIEPGRFIIPAGSFDNPAVLVVGPSSWWRDIDAEQQLIEIPVSSIQIADSIVKDYCNGVLGCDMGSKMPGLFFIPGEIDSKTVKLKYSDAVNKAAAKQKNLYMELVHLADMLWATSNGNPRTINEDMRIAARELNLNNKDWLKDFQMAAMERCFACGSLKNPDYPVCASCRAIDQSHPKAKDIKFAS